MTCAPPMAVVLIRGGREVEVDDEEEDEGTTKERVGDRRGAS